MAELNITKSCFACGGSGRVDDWVNGVNAGKDCTVCSGNGKLSAENIDITELMALLNKMSSNLDDIMVKLDV
jgi:DnaJ-class molecular chaperone